MVKLCFNPCKGFRCFEAQKKWRSLNITGFNPCKGFRCFEARVCGGFMPCSGRVSIPVRVLDVLKQASLVIIMGLKGYVSIPVRVLDVLKRR